MSRSTIIWLQTLACAVGCCLVTGPQMIGPKAIAALPQPLDVPTRFLSSSELQPQVAQLFKNSPSIAPPATPTGCGPQGCRLNTRPAVLTLPAGTSLKTTYPGKDTQILQTGETRQLLLTVREPVRNTAGEVVIPAESTIQGQVVPVQGGGQFVANVITINGKPYNLAAKSVTLHDVKDPRETNAGAIATDAGIGAAGAAVLGQVLAGRVNTIEVIGGAIAGVVIGNVTAPQAVVINPGDEISLQLTDPFRLQ